MSCIQSFRLSMRSISKHTSEDCNYINWKHHIDQLFNMLVVLDGMTKMKKPSIPATVVDQVIDSYLFIISRQNCKCMYLEQGLFTKYVTHFFAISDHPPTSDYAKMHFQCESTYLQYAFVTLLLTTHPPMLWNVL